MRYENGGDGLLYSDDGGASFRLLCGSAIAPGFRRGGAIHVASDRHVLMGAFDGLWEDDGRGCAWTRVAALEGLWVNDIVAHPTNPDVTFAITSSGGKKNGVLRRDKSGKWTDLGSKAEILIGRLHVVQHGSGLRFYESAVLGETMAEDGGAPKPRYAIRISDDDAQTWQEHPIQINDGTLRLEAVDPTDSERLVVSINRDGADDSILVSDDAGETFRDYLELAELGGVASAGDGRFWFGEAGNGRDMRKGVFATQSLAKPATLLPKADYSVSCLRHRAEDDEVYACKLLEVGTIAADGSFATVIALKEVPALVTCEGVDMSAACEAQLCAEYCGPGHFASAPMCAAYETLACGPCADDPTSPACSLAPMAEPDASAGGVTDAGSRVDDNTQSGNDSSSCACVAVSAGHVPRSTVWLAGFGLLLVSLRSRGRRVVWTRES